MNFILLSNRGVIGLYGSEAKDFLNRITTNNILKLSPQNPLYSLILNSKGRYMYDFFIVESKNELLLDCNINDLNVLMENLKLYKLNLKIKIKNLSRKCKVGVYIDKVDHDVENQYVFYDPRCTSLGMRSILFDSDLQFPVTDCIEYEKLRIEKIIPDSSKDMVKGESFPLHYGIHKLNGIDFEKGCYVGQEVVARMYRANPKKMCYLVKSLSKMKLPYREKIMMNDEDIGVSLSSCGDTGLALLSIDKVTYGLENKCRFHIGKEHDLTILDNRL